MHTRTTVTQRKPKNCLFPDDRGATAVLGTVMMLAVMVSLVPGAMVLQQTIHEANQSQTELNLFYIQCNRDEMDPDRVPHEACPTYEPATGSDLVDKIPLPTDIGTIKGTHNESDQD